MRYSNNRLVMKASGAIATMMVSSQAFATQIGTTVPITNFLNQFVDLLTGDVARAIALISLVLAIAMFAWNQHQGNEATGLFKTFGVMGMSIAALCGVGQLFSWMGYGFMIF